MCAAVASGGVRGERRPCAVSGQVMCAAGRRAGCVWALVDCVRLLVPDWDPGGEREGSCDVGGLSEGWVSQSLDPSMVCGAQAAWWAAPAAGVESTVGPVRPVSLPSQVLRTRPRVGLGLEDVEREGGPKSGLLAVVRPFQPHKRSQHHGASPCRHRLAAGPPP